MTAALRTAVDGDDWRIKVGAMSKHAMTLHNEVCAQALFARVAGGVGAWRAQRHFGGICLHGPHGLFCIVCNGRMFLRVDELTCLRRERAGDIAFEPYGGDAMRDYLEVPAAVLADGEQLRQAMEQAAALPASSTVLH